MTLSPAIVSLNNGELLNPREHLSDRWRSLQVVSLARGEERQLASEDVEHALYIIRGDGDARTPSQVIPLTPGTAITMPLGAALELVAGDAGLRFFHVVLGVPNASP